jgi:hypothetical protein
MSCDDSEYYKTFDYKTMSFKERTSKSDFCVKKISETNDKIEMEVFFDFNKIKRTFIKKDGYWYSKYKFETVDVPFFADAFGDKFEFEYYIYPTHIILTNYEFVNYVDLDKEEISVYDDVKIKDFNKPAKEKLWIKTSFFNSDGHLYENSKYYKHGNFEGDSSNYKGKYDADIDFFYLLDLEIYSPGPGIKPIYDSNSEE